MFNKPASFIAQVGEWSNVQQPYPDLGQHLGLLPVFEMIVVIASLRSNDQVASCRVKEHFVDLSLRDLSGDFNVYVFEETCLKKINVGTLMVMLLCA